MLSEAYPALLMLSRVRYPNADGEGQGEDYKHKMAFLDNVLRKGILAGYAHCPEHVRVVKVLVEQLATYIDEMGIWGVKHLKVRLSRRLLSLGSNLIKHHPLFRIFSRQPTNPFPHLLPLKC